MYRITPQTRDANTNVGADRCVCPMHTDAIHRCITQTGRTVKPFHNGNRCVARSGTCGDIPQERRPRRRSNRSQPRHPFDLFKVGPSSGVFPAGGASRATQRLAMVGQLRRPYASWDKIKAVFCNDSFHHASLQCAPRWNFCFMDYSKAVMLAADISSLEKANIFLPRSFREAPM